MNEEKCGVWHCGNSCWCAMTIPDGAGAYYTFDKTVAKDNLTIFTNLYKFHTYQIRKHTKECNGKNIDVSPFKKCCIGEELSLPTKEEVEYLINFLELD